ncbi:MAG: penicillin-binding protein 1A [Gammaproteobacteria bacterium]|nr:penicillin-binding protein 1A [Gammaproteobacteria bacterium]
MAYHVYSEELPDVNALRDIQYQVPLRIYDRHGGLIAEFGEKRRIPVSIDQIPELVEKAFLAAEDDRFYQHPGVDLQGLFRAGWELLRTGHKGQGGSTITMQVARNFFLSSEKTYSRKFREILLAVKIERELTKRQILELYLNKIYLGNRAYGVAAAASIYYNKPLDALTPAEAAMLAGLPKAPSKFNPVVNPERAKIRRDYILGRMGELGWLTEEQVKAAQLEPVQTTLFLGAESEVSAPYVAEMVRARMVEQFGEAAYEMGLRVYTTLDPELQRTASLALRNALLDYDRRHGWRGAEGRVEFPVGDVEAAASHARAQRLVEGLIAAVVLEVEARQATVVDGQGRRHVLDLESLQWARPYLSEDAMGPRPKSVAEVLSPGDIVRLRQGEKGYTLAQLPQVEGAFVAFDSTSGALLALEGGYDFSLSKFNRVTQAQRQPGSSFKPFLYSAALENGFTLASVISDDPRVYEKAAANKKDWQPQNYGGKFYGPTRLHEALVRSQNLVSVRLMEAITPEVVLRHAKSFGLPVGQWQPTLSLALGSYALTPWELTAAYMVFANGGYRVEPYFIQRVEDLRGNVLFEAVPQHFCDNELAFLPKGAGQLREKRVSPTTLPSGRRCQPGVLGQAPRVISPENAWLVQVMLRDVVKRGTAASAGRALKRPDIGGKTGTTNDQRDAWFSGFGPGVVATAWVGFDDYRPLGRMETGGKVAVPMWVDFMQVALKDRPVQELKPPPGIITASIDPGTGQIVPSGTPGAIIEYFDVRYPQVTTAVMPEYLPSQAISEAIGDRQMVEELF